MILNDDVLDTIARNLKGDNKPFRSKWSNLIAKWSLEHHEKFKTAPKEAIQNRLSRFADSNTDEDIVGLVETFLQGLSDDATAQAEEINIPFVVDLASRHFNTVRLETLVKKMNRSLEAKDVESAEELLAAHNPITFAGFDWGDMANKEKIKLMYGETASKQLIQFPGALDLFLGQSFGRDTFISFAGPEKRGKSYWLMEVVYQAAKQRRNVLYYVTGDMSEEDTWERFHQRASRRPEKSQTLDIPTSISKRDEEIRVTKESREAPKLTGKKAYETMKEFIRKTGSDELRIKTKVAPSSTLTASDIEADVLEWVGKGFVPDVVVVDYADILSPEINSRQMDFRHQQNETWKVLRRISQRFHLCMVTATQTAASSYKSKTIQKGDFSEDKRKAAHVTGMLGINQTSKEKVDGVYRLNWIVLRKGVWADHQTVTTAGNLAIANPCIVSAII